VKIQLPHAPRRPGPFDHDDLRRYGLICIEFDRSLRDDHHVELRRLAQEVVDAFESPDDYRVPRLWIVKIEALRNHLRGA
jgi:hypothetical protein